MYFLAEQMGASVKMIEEHYGHVNTVKHAGLVLQGTGGWAAQPASSTRLRPPGGPLTGNLVWAEWGRPVRQLRLDSNRDNRHFFGRDNCHFWLVRVSRT